MGIFDRLTGRNSETLEAFLRRMLRDIMMQDPDSSMPGYFDVLADLPLDQLVSTVPATIMTITEQYDQCRSQGASNADALALIESHRQFLLVAIGASDSVEEFSVTTSLEDYIVHVVNREQQDTGPFSLDRDVVASVVKEAREFGRRNPKHTMLDMQAKLQAALRQ